MSIWSAADMTPGELNRLYPKPYEYESILHPQPNVSERSALEGAFWAGFINALLIELGTVLLVGALYLWAAR